ncbi:MAG: selenocysteine-specific translation elongation factor, partial [Gemmatimonadota bacterium]
KTALIHALTGTDTDRLPEEKRRGITIDLGFAHLALSGGLDVGIIDVPGHEAFIRNMLAGATGIDLALLVVAADEGVMPQTREHTAILGLLGVGTLVVALTKTDAVEPEWAALAADDVRSFLAESPFAGAPIVPVSARTGAGLDALRDALAHAAGSVRQRTEEDRFRLPIDRIFTVHGTGTVVTGTVWSGSVRRDETLRLLPADRTVRVRGLQSHGIDRDRLGAGERGAIALAGTTREEIGRGDVLVRGPGWEGSNRLTLRLLALPEADAGLKHGQRVRFHVATSEVIGRLATAGTPLIAAGSEARMQIRLEAPVVARAGDPFVIRSYSPITTLGGGRIVEPAPPRRKRLSDRMRADLHAIIDGSVTDSLAARARLAGRGGEPAERLTVTTRHGPAAIDTALADGEIRIRDGRIFDPALIEDARNRLMAAVSSHHRAEPLSPGLPLEDLRTRRPARAPRSLADSLIADLVRDGSLVVEAGRAHDPDFRPTLRPGQETAIRDILAEVERAGFAAPTAQELPAAIAARPDLDDLLHYLVRTGRLVQPAAGRFLTAAALDRAVRLAVSTFGDRSDLAPGDFRDLFGISRKYLIPLLEHFDRTGVTIRDGDGRQMAAGASSGG